MKKWIEWFADNHVASNLLMAFLLVAGVVMIITAKVEVFPETSPNFITIKVVYPGASPSEVEESVTRRIEERIAGVSGIKKIESYSSEGLSLIVVEVLDGWDVKDVLDDIDSEVSRITSLPEESERPIVSRVVLKRQVINVVVYGDVPELTLREVAKNIKDRLTLIQGITEAELKALREPEVHVEVSEETLRKYGLSLEEIAAIIRSESLDLPAGSIKTRGNEILVRTLGKKYYARDFMKIPVIVGPGGSKLTLGEIAKVSDGVEEVDLFARYRGKRAAIIQVFRVGDQNALTVSRKVREFVKEIAPTLPDGIYVDTFQDRSEVLRSRIRLLLKNMAYGMVLVITVLGLFTNLKLAFWIALGIPISFSFCFWLLPQFDVSINMISLFAFVMVLGMVVDDAIVIGENVFRKREEGLPPLKASVEGTFEVGRAVIFSVLTTMAAFWPLLLGTGVMGKFIRNIPIVVILVLAGSLTESLFVLPSHLAITRFRKEDRKENHSRKWLRKFIEGPYSGFLSLSLKYRYVTVSIAVVLLLFMLGLWFGGRLSLVFLPRVESDNMIAEVTMPAGTPASRTVEVVERLEKTAEEVVKEAEKNRKNDGEPLLRSIISMVGVKLRISGHEEGVSGIGGNLGQVVVQLIGAEKREDISTKDLVKRWRQKMGEVPGAESLTYQSELFSAGSPIQVNLFSDDDEKLARAVEELKKILRGYRGVFDIADSSIPGKDELRVRLNEEAESLGVTLDDVARALRHAYYGAEAMRFQRGEDEVKVLVRYPEKERKSLSSIASMRIRLRDGRMVPLSQVAEITHKQGYVSLRRYQRGRVISVTADVDETVTNASKIRRELKEKVLPALVEKYGNVSFSFEGEGKEEEEAFTDIFQGFALALFLIYTLLAIPLRSFSQPLIIMTAIPFGIVGAFLGHIILGLNLSILSMFGIVGLAGVVVNDSLVLVDAINRLRKAGVGLREAVMKGGKLRFRPIILTTVTTFAGLAPMMAERSLQARFLIPMAVSLAFGVLFSTLITLVLVPCGYLILEDVKGIFSRKDT